MKLSPFAVLSFAIAVAPTVVATTQKCKVESDWDTKDSARNPHYPSIAERKMVSEILREAYEHAHSDDDYNMSSSRYVLESAHVP